MIDKSTMLVGGLIILNVVLVAGIWYMHTQHKEKMAQIKKVESTKTTNGFQYRIAIVETMGSKGEQEIVSGFKDTVNKLFPSEVYIKEFNPNGSRSLIQAQIKEILSPLPGEPGYDLIFTIGSQTSKMAKEISLKMTPKDKNCIPIIFGATGDPVKLELVANPTNSGNHLTGISVIGTTWIERMVEIIPQLDGKVRKVLIPYDPSGLGGALESYKVQFEKELKKHKVEVVDVKIYETSEILQKVSPFMHDVDWVILLPDATMLEGIGGMSKLCEQYKRPLFVAMNLATIEEGAALSYGYHASAIGVGAARYAYKILEENVHPSQLPVDSLEETYRLGINVENARKQGLSDRINPTLMFLLENSQVV